jgi:diacylglycerol kinase family enzyme
VRILTIVNLRSGQADAGLYDYLRALGRSECEIVVRFIGQKRTLHSMLEDAKEYDRVVAVGGDGTVSGVCYELRDTGIPMLPYPAGTTNLLALNLRLPTEPLELADLTTNGAIRSIDIGELACLRPGDDCSPEGATEDWAGRSRRGFMIMAGAGFDAAIMDAAREYKHTVGWGAYLVGALQNLIPTRSRFQLELDGESTEREGIAVLVANAARLKFDLSFSRSSDPADGIFEVIIVRTRNAVELLPAVWTTLASRAIDLPDKTPGLEILRARTVRVDAEPELALQYDGEYIGANTPFKATVLPGAGTLVVSDTFLEEWGHD